jgi:Trypsin-like peptidase domain
MIRISRVRTAIAIGSLTLLSTLSTTLPSPAITRTVTRKVQPASVQLGPLYSVVDPKTGKKAYGSFGWGSGTIISPAGHILTNQHVTDIEGERERARQNNAELVDGVVVVYMSKRTDEPPIPVFIADVIVADEKLDLAVVKIARNLKFETVDPSTMNLPWVPLGDSDLVELGDTLNVFGYPGIGGKTITYTSGPVSGFATDANIPGRAWIKTSASISGGNSGGTAVDDDGFLVGIPTRGGVEGAGGIVDCRPLADTNRDGAIDDKDTCVPAGGFINSLRTINPGKSMITSALTNTGSAPGGGGAGIPPQPTQPPPTQPQPTQPPPTAPPAARNVQDVAIRGYIIDATTGRPIVGAWFFVLNTGVKWSKDLIPERDLFADAQTDSNGYFELRARLIRGKPYSMGNSADGYRGVAADDVKVPTSGPDPINMTLKMEPQ